MANNANLKNAVKQVIKTNHTEAITGNILQNILVDIIDNLGANASYAGIASPTTNPGTPDGFVFYLTVTPGTYTNFGGIQAQEGYVTILKNNASGAWLKDELKVYPPVYGAEYAGLATPTTDPGSPKGLVFYLTTTAGTYTNFGGLEVQKDFLTILKNTDTGTWQKDELQLPKNAPAYAYFNHLSNKDIFIQIKGKTISIETPVGVNAITTGVLSGVAIDDFTNPNDWQNVCLVYNHDTHKFTYINPFTTPIDGNILLYVSYAINNQPSVIFSSVPVIVGEYLAPKDIFYNQLKLTQFNKYDTLIGGQIIIFPKGNSYIKENNFLHIIGSSLYPVRCTQTGNLAGATFSNAGTYMLYYDSDTQKYDVHEMRVSNYYNTLVDKYNHIYIVAFITIDSAKNVTDFWTTSPFHVQCYNTQPTSMEWKSKLDIKNSGIIDFLPSTQQIKIKSGQHTSIPGNNYAAPLINVTSDITENAKKDDTIPGIYGVFRDLNWGNYILIKVSPYYEYSDIIYCFLSALFRIDNNNAGSLIWASNPALFTINGQPISESGGGEYDDDTIKNILDRLTALENNGGGGGDLSSIIARLNDVEKLAASAKTTADSASTAASNAQSTANSAKTTADSASTAASNAQSTAKSAKMIADSASQWKFPSYMSGSSPISLTDGGCYAFPTSGAQPSITPLSISLGSKTYGRATFIFLSSGKIRISSSVLLIKNGVVSTVSSDISLSKGGICEIIFTSTSIKAIFVNGI